MFANWTKICQRLSSTNTFLKISEEVRYALDSKAAVIALESTVITHGMPRPQNLETAKRLEFLARQFNCVPATVAVMDNKLCVGLTDSELERLGDCSSAVKISRQDLAVSLSTMATGGTTVSATMIAANLAGISVFATGGIGGVHRGAVESFDISCDLTELGRTPVAVVSAGVKSILDVPKTLEYLETEGVPVITYGSTNDFPGFYSPKSGLKSPYNYDSAEKIAEIIKRSLDMGLKNGLLIGVPVTEKSALSDKVERAVQQALLEMRKSNVSGKEVTPYLLKRVNELSGGASLELNIRLLENNVVHAAKIAVALSKFNKEKSNSAPNCSVSSGCKSKVSDVVLFGGSLLDCYADAPRDELQNDFSSHCLSGKITLLAGGVARNHADALQRLGLRAYLVSALGCDNNAALLRSLCRHMDLSGVTSIDSAPTAGYVGCSIAGSLKIGILSTDIFKHVDANMVISAEDRLRNAKLCFVDANIPSQTIKTVCDTCDRFNIPVWFEPSDSHVAGKIVDADCWARVSYLSPNWLEFKQLLKIVCNISIADDFLKSLKSFSDFYPSLLNWTPLFLRPRHEAIILTIDTKGSIIIHKSKKTGEYRIVHYSSPKLSRNVVNVSGAGDCLNSGIIFGIVNGWSMDRSVGLGIELAAQSLGSVEPIPSTLALKEPTSEYPHTAEIIFETSFRL